MKVKWKQRKMYAHVDRFKNFEMSSSNIRNNYDWIFFKKKKKKKNGPYELCDQCRPD